MSKRKSSNELDRPMPKQRKEAKVEINTTNCDDPFWGDGVNEKMQSMTLKNPHC